MSLWRSCFLSAVYYQGMVVRLQRHSASMNTSSLVLTTYYYYYCCLFRVVFNALYLPRFLFFALGVKVGECCLCLQLCILFSAIVRARAHCSLGVSLSCCLFLARDSHRSTDNFIQKTKKLYDDTNSQRNLSKVCILWSRFLSTRIF